MADINTITQSLFDCNYFADDFDNDDSYEHLEIAEAQIKEYGWDDVFASWFDYLNKQCHDPEDVINFANLFVYYGGTDYPIRTPYDFLAVLYARVNMDKYWEKAGDVFDSLATSVLEKSGEIDLIDDPYYQVLDDPKLKKAIVAIID